MEQIKSIGLVGRGFLGRTLEYVFSRLAKKRPLDLRIYDKNPSLSLNTLEEVSQCEVVFVGVPTPFVEQTGECYTGFVEGAIKDLRALNKENLIVIKSTVPPGTCAKWDEQYGNIVFNPEFLTEKSPELDFCELDYQILGIQSNGMNHIIGDEKYISDIIALENLFMELGEVGITRCDHIYLVTHTVAEMTKYVRNCYLATRLSFFNEIAQVCEKLNINYNQVKHLAGYDKRVGNHYNNIHTEHPFFFGHCLPKDLNAFIYLAEQLGIDPKVSKGVKEKNLERSEGFDRDWEKMNGRAVISLKDIKKD